MFWDFGSSCIRRCGVLNASCCGSECKARFWFSLVLPNVSFLRPAGVRVVPTETVMSAFSLVVSSTGNFNISIFGLHEEVEVQCVRWSNSQFQHHDIRKCRKPWRHKTSTFTRSWTCQCFTTPRTQTRNSCHHLQGRVSTGQNFETIHVGTPVFFSLPGVTVLIIVVHQDVIMDYLVRRAHIRSTREIWMDDSFSWKICAELCWLHGRRCSQKSLLSLSNVSSVVYINVSVLPEIAGHVYQTYVSF